MKLRRLRDLREDNDFTQTDIARKIGISQRVYAYYESGEHTIPIELLIDLADIYDVSLDYLVGRTDDKKRF